MLEREFTRERRLRERAVYAGFNDARDDERHERMKIVYFDGEDSACCYSIRPLDDERQRAITRATLSTYAAMKR